MQTEIFGSAAITFCYDLTERTLSRFYPCPGHTEDPKEASPQNCQQPENSQKSEVIRKDEFGLVTNIPQDGGRGHGCIPVRTYLGLLTLKTLWGIYGSPVNTDPRDMTKTFNPFPIPSVAVWKTITFTQFLKPSTVSCGSDTITV